MAAPFAGRNQHPAGVVISFVRAGLLAPVRVAGRDGLFHLTPQTALSAFRLMLPSGCGPNGKPMRERAIDAVGEPVSDSSAATPPIIQRSEIVSFCLVALLIVAIIAVLYVARAFFLPVVTAIILGTMLSPAAKRLESYLVPRPVSAALIVILTWAAFVLMIGLISEPVMDWFSKLPELGPILKDKLHVFDRPLAIWHQLQTMLGAPEGAETSLQLPKVAWVQPTLELLSPTFTELLLFFAVLVLFIASWPDLRRALVMNFPNRDSRLRMLRILNEIETNLGGYLLTVSLINAGVGIATSIACVFVF